LSHAERGESLQNQDFVGGMQKRRRFAAAPLGFQKPISKNCGDDFRNFEPVIAAKSLSFSKLDKIICKLRLTFKENSASFDVPAFAQKIY